jgi:hypothetical protein
MHHDAGAGGAGTTGTLTEGDGGGKFATGTCGTGSVEGTAILFSCKGALCSIPPR